MTIAKAAATTADERTGHHLRRLQASICDLQNALAVASHAQPRSRPPRSSLTPDTTAADDPYSRIVANNDRGIVRDIERLQDIGAVVLGLQGLGSLIAESLCR
ncbi:hypothetical protein PINS_up002106 [Pythium insidiosum]|nr:hypothetical protein PINS_up002106 [Pythium insidiosum]